MLSRSGNYRTVTTPFCFSPFTFLLLRVMIAIPILTAFFCVAIGRIQIPLNETMHDFIQLFSGHASKDMNFNILFNIRLPRVLMAGIIGAGLTCAGATFQSLFSNPLATPDILGVTSGSCVGAIIAIIFSLNLISVQLIALLFGLFAVYIAIKISYSKRGSIVNLVLSGLIISALFNAVAALLKYTADPLEKLPEITYWLLGSLSGITYTRLLIASPFIIAGIVIIFLMRWQLNILSLSEDEARSSGINLKRVRLIFIFASTIITASAVSVCGQIGWVGLLIPHSARMLVGSNNRFIIPVSISLGAAFLIIIDTLSRTVGKVELPLSILTALAGAPLFLYLLKKSEGTFYDN